MGYGSRKIVPRYDQKHDLPIHPEAGPGWGTQGIQEQNAKGHKKLSDQKKQYINITLKEN